MRPLVAAMAALTCACATAPATPPSPTSELALMAGRWEAAIQGPGATPLAAIILIQDATLLAEPLESEERSETWRATLTLAPAQPDHAIDFAQEGRDAPILGRYAWTSQTHDQLMLCFPAAPDGPRPDHATPCDGPDLVRFTLRRAP